MVEQRKFVAWSRDREAIYTRNAVNRSPEAHRWVLRCFARWLEETRQLRQSTVRNRLGGVRPFLAEIATEGETFEAALAALDAPRIEDFFVGYCHDAGPSARRSLQAAMRLFLRFASWRGWCSDRLVDAVPRLRTWRLSGIPRGLSDDDTDRLLKSVMGPEQRARDRAIIFLLIIYGVRRGQLVDLKLSHVDWRERTILFEPNKGSLRVLHSLTNAVAGALADYIRSERPDTGSDYLFLRCRRPYLPLGPSAMTEVVRSRLVRLEVKTAPMGPHGLRHAFATRLLAAGQSMKTVADLLGHRSLAATSIYAKVDHPRLLEVAMDWPEVQS